MQKTISFLIEEDVKKTLTEMADEDDRSLTAYLRIKLTKIAKQWKDKIDAHVKRGTPQTHLK